MELIPEALGQLDDEHINGLAITEVDCRNGKYDAKVYYDGSDFNKQEQKLVRMALRKANGAIKSYILNATGWYKCPNFEFAIDDMMDKRARMDQLFAMIEKDENRKKSE